jgi:hypothetical protein
MNSSLRQRFQHHPTLPGALYLDLNGRRWEVTFDPAVADAHPGRVRLLTLGEPLLEELLALVGPPVSVETGRGLVRARAGELIRWYAVRGGSLIPVSTLAQFRENLNMGTEELTEAHRVEIQQDIEREAVKRYHQVAGAEQKRKEERRAGLEERGRLLLALAAACQQVLLDTTLFEPAWRSLLRYPFAPLARLVGSPEEAEVVRARSRIPDPDAARRRLEAADKEARTLVHHLQAMTLAAQPSSAQTITVTLEILPLS